MKELNSVKWIFIVLGFFPLIAIYVLFITRPHLLIIIAVSLFVLSVMGIYFLEAWLIHKRIKSGYWLGMVLGILSLLNFPTGTALGILILVFLHRNKAEFVKSKKWAVAIPIIFTIFIIIVIYFFYLASSYAAQEPIDFEYSEPIILEIPVPSVSSDYCDDTIFCDLFDSKSYSNWQELIGHEWDIDEGSLHYRGRAKDGGKTGVLVTKQTFEGDIQIEANMILTSEVLPNQDAVYFYFLYQDDKFSHSLERHTITSDNPYDFIVQTDVGSEKRIHTKEGSLMLDEWFNVKTTIKEGRALVYVDDVLYFAVDKIKGPSKIAMGFHGSGRIDNVRVTKIS